MTTREEVQNNKTSTKQVVHRRVYNGTTVCSPMGEGKRWDNAKTTYDDNEVTCRKCLKGLWSVRR